jgi:hypothetical protein
MDTCHQPSAVSKRLLMADCRWLMAFLDKAGHAVGAQEKMAVSSLVDEGTGLTTLARRNTSVGAPNDVLSIRVEVSTRRCPQEAHSRKMLAH